MNLLFLYTIPAFALAWIIGRAQISFPIRNWLAGRNWPGVPFLLDLIDCPACFGVWIGFITGLIFVGFGTACFLALWTCGTNLILGSLIGLYDEKG
jgi:hypothetical protein